MTAGEEKVLRDPFLLPLQAGLPPGYTREPRPPPSRVRSALASLTSPYLARHGPVPEPIGQPPVARGAPLVRRGRPPGSGSKAESKYHVGLGVADLPRVGTRRRLPPSALASSQDVSRPRIEHESSGAGLAPPRSGYAYTPSGLLVEKCRCMCLLPPAPFPYFPPLSTLFSVVFFCPFLSPKARRHGCLKCPGVCVWICFFSRGAGREWATKGWKGSLVTFLLRIHNS